jgi:hypothetical protein
MLTDAFARMSLESGWIELRSGAGKTKVRKAIDTRPTLTLLHPVQPAD